MLKRILLALVCLLAPAALRAQQCTVGGTGSGSVTVSGNLQDLGGQNITALTTFVRFTLTGYGANIPRISGTTAIAAPCYDLKPNGSGVIGGTIWGNDKISVGGNPAGGTFYIVCTFQSGQPFRCNNFTVNGSTFNLNSAAPNTTNPTPPAPLSASFIAYDASTSESAASFPSTTLFTPSVNQTYLVSGRVTQSVATVGCSGQPSLVATISWTDADSGQSLSSNVWTIPNSGVAGNATTMTFSGSLSNATTWTFDLGPVIRAKAGTVVSFSAAYSAGSGCSTGATYIIQPVLLTE